MWRTCRRSAARTACTPYQGRRGVRSWTRAHPRKRWGAKGGGQTPRDTSGRLRSDPRNTNDLAASADARETLIPTCKQGVVGSSPISSTPEVPLAALPGRRTWPPGARHDLHVTLRIKKARSRTRVSSQRPPRSARSRGRERLIRCLHGVGPRPGSGGVSASVDGVPIDEVAGDGANHP